MRRIRLFFVLVIIANVGQSVPSYALQAAPPAPREVSQPLEVTPALLPTPVTLDPPTPLPVGEVIITGYQFVAGQLDYLELYNKSSDMIRLDGWRVTVRVMQDGKLQPIEQRLVGYALPKKHLMIARDGATTERDLTLTLPNDLPAPVSLTLGVPGMYETPTKAMAFASGVAYTLRQTTTGYTTTNDFLTSGAQPKFGGLYAPPLDSPLRVREIFANTRPCGPTEDAVDCHEFVKLCNLGDVPVALDLYRLRLGAANASVGITNAVPLAGALAAGDCRSIETRSDGAWLDVPSSGHIWLEDSYGVQVYAATDVAYDTINVAAHDGQSWAFDSSDGVWKWAWPRPVGQAADFVVAPPTTTVGALAECRDGQYRSAETGRCRSLAVTDGRVPCRDDQYRSEETGRCRNLAVAASSIKACAEDQFRNPATGRCKQIASTDDLAPCKPGQERNPDTNRCRNLAISDMPKADFAVQPTPAGDKAFSAWWALGGLGLVAVSYGAWEWRSELRRMARRLHGDFVSRRK